MLECRNRLMTALNHCDSERDGRAADVVNKSSFSDLLLPADFKGWRTIVTPYALKLMKHQLNVSKIPACIPKEHTPTSLIELR